MKILILHNYYIIHWFLTWGGFMGRAISRDRVGMKLIMFIYLKTHGENLTLIRPGAVYY